MFPSHDPKGVSGASSGQVYVADGAGSGDWTASQAQGWGRYDDSAGTQVFGTSYSKFTIDGLGADSNSSYLPLEIRGSAELWDPVDDVITPIALGDSYLIRFHFDVTGVTGTPTLFFPVLDDSGGGSPTSIVTSSLLPLAGSSFYSVHELVAINNGDPLANGLGFWMGVDTGTITVDNKRVVITRLSSGAL